MRRLPGFHPPRFSEGDDAWLPGWLQPPSSSSLRELDTNPDEELGSLQQNVRDGDFSNDERCKSFRLFLSGEDDSQMSYPSSSSNHEVRYHLHISTEDSQYTLNPVLSRSQPEAKIVHEEDTHKVNCKDDETFIVPSKPNDNVGISHHESPSFKEQKKKNSKIDTGSRKVDFVNAIELAIAASEALEIHEIVKHVPITDFSIGSAVLEAATRVKQARLENCIETLCSSSVEESSEIDCYFLSDLDELAMADAYEDVGLTVDCHGSLSHVKDSYASENYISEAKHVEVDSAFNSSKEQHKQVDNANELLKRVYVKETFEGNTHEEHVGYEELGTENTNLACDVDPVLSCSVEKAEFCMTEVNLERDRIVGDLTSLHAIERSSLQSGISRCNEKEDKMKSLVPDRFESRWFGGWTSKNGSCIPAVNDNKCKRHINELFANETSSISESADIAPDMNSCIQKYDNECNFISQTSATPECAYEKASNGGNYCSDDLPGVPIVPLNHSFEKSSTTGNLLSDGVAVFPSMSPDDPLCSVVPCSFTSNSDGHSLVSQKCEQPVLSEKRLRPTDNIDTPKRVSPLSEGSPTVRRQVVSLKTYSMLDPTISSNREETRIESLPSKHVPAVMETPPLNLRGDNDGINQTAKGDTEFTSEMVKKMNLPVTINNEKNKVVLKSNVELLPTTVSGKVKSTCKSFFRRKRVHFLEPEISFPQVKKFKQWPEDRRENRLAASKECRGLRSSKLQPKKMLFQGLQFLLTGFSVKKHNEIKNLILENGGMVFDDIPSTTLRGKRGLKLPLIMCPKKLLTTKFLYGCAVNAYILKVKWLFDSVSEGSILPPKKYMILKEHATSKNCDILGKPVCKAHFLFSNIGIMLHGKPNFCSKMAKIIKYGGGLVFKTLHWLVKRLDSEKVSMGAIVVEDENCISRQLKQCALEQKIPTMPFSWIVNSLYAGRLLLSSEFKVSDNPVHVELSEEI